jgi:hypothetical protein
MALIKEAVREEPGALAAAPAVGRSVRQTGTEGDRWSS